MSKKLLSILIASLFVAAPAARAEPDDHAVGYAGLGRRSAASAPTSTRRTPPGSSSTGPAQRRAVEHRAPRPQRRRGSGSTLRRELRPRRQYFNLRGGMYDVFKCRRVHRLAPAAPCSFNARTPFSGSGHGDLRGDVPAARTRRPGSTIDIGYDRRDTGGYFEWQSNSPVVLPRRRQPGDAATAPRSAPRRTARARATASSTSRSRSTTARRTPRSRAATAPPSTSSRRATGCRKFDNGQRDGDLEQPVLGERHRHDVPGAGQRLPALRAAGRRSASCRWHSTLAARFTWDKLESDTDLATRALERHRSGGLRCDEPERRHVQRRRREHHVLARAVVRRR